MDNLVSLQQAMTHGVFEQTHAENLRDRDITLHFEALAEEYGPDETDTFHRFKASMAELGYMIETLKKGMNGEGLAKNSLKLLACNKDIPYPV